MGPPKWINPCRCVLDRNPVAPKSDASGLCHRGILENRSKIEQPCWFWNRIVVDEGNNISGGLRHSGISSSRDIGCVEVDNRIQLHLLCNSGALCTGNDHGFEPGIVELPNRPQASPKPTGPAPTDDYDADRKQGHPADQTAVRSMPGAVATKNGLAKVGLPYVSVCRSSSRRTSPPAPFRTACPAAVSHSIVRPSLG